VAVDGANEGHPLTKPERVPQTLQRAQRRRPLPFQRVVDRQRIGVVHEEARVAAAARAFPDRMAAEEGITDAQRVGDEAAQRRQRHLGVGDQLGKVPHHRRLVQHRQRGQRRLRRVKTTQTVLVPGRARHGIGQQGVQPLALQRGQCASVEVARRGHGQPGRHRGPGVSGVHKDRSALGPAVLASAQWPAAVGLRRTHDGGSTKIL
jgi:hypothetical protein